MLQMKQTDFLSCSVRNCSEKNTVKCSPYTFTSLPSFRKYILLRQILCNYNVAILISTILVFIANICACCSYPFISKLREGIDDDTKHDIEADSCHNDEEGNIIEQTQTSRIPCRGYQWHNL